MVLTVDVDVRTVSRVPGAFPYMEIYSTIARK
jgi:hypothetical protein